MALYELSRQLSSLSGSEFLVIAAGIGGTERVTRALRRGIRVVNAVGGTLVILMGLLCTLPSAVKRVGDIFLFLPSRLGLIQRVTPDQVNKIDLTTASPAILEFPRAGKYAVYSGDTALLALAALRTDLCCWHGGYIHGARI